MPTPTTVRHQQLREGPSLFLMVPAGLKSLLFRHLLFKLGRAGHGPWAGHASVGLGLGLVTGGDRCARDAARQNRQKCLCL